MSKVTLYGADWCIPCQNFKPHFKAASEGYLASDLGVEFDYQDVDEMSPQELTELSIRAVPTILFDNDGEVHQVSPNGQKKFEMEIEHLMKLNSD